MRKRAWRNKGIGSVRSIRKENENFAGAKVSIDQLVVAQPGLVPHISGQHTNARVCKATGFFDNSTGHSFSSLQTSLDGDQTLSVKHSFESHAASCGVRIKKYRADMEGLQKNLSLMMSKDHNSILTFVQLVITIKMG